MNSWLGVRLRSVEMEWLFHDSINDCSVELIRGRYT